MALERPVSAVAWDLRAAWAAGWRVSVTVDAVDRQRIEGHVTRVSPSSAFAIIARLHVPLGRVLAVHRPSLLGDSTWRSGEWRAAVPRAIADERAWCAAGQLQLAGVER